MCVEYVTNELKAVIDEYKIEHIGWAWIPDIKQGIFNSYILWNVKTLSFIANKHQCLTKTGGLHFKSISLQQKYK